MVCQVRYLNSAGIVRREIPGIDALSKAYPPEWLLYASLNCYPRAQDPMEIDALVILDDRVLLLELKDWNGKLTQRGDLWFVNGQFRGRSAVIQAGEKAKKLKTVLVNEIPKLKQLWVDYRVVLTATSTKEHIPDEHQKFIWRLDEACQIAQPQLRRRLLSQQKLGLLKAFQFEEDFDRVTNNSRIFQPLEADWGGYRVVEENVVDHPRHVWREHRAERSGEARLKALLRVWSFDRLPAGLNSPDRRRFIVDREVKAFAHLTANGSPLVDRSAILREIGTRSQEVLTHHFELRTLPQDWLTWDRFLEAARDRLDLSDRVVLAANLLNCVSELHKNDIAHRDLGPRAVWVGSPSKLALNGFMCCQLPEEESVADWLSTLKGYAPEIPEDSGQVKTSGQRRDVYLLGQLVRSAMRDAGASLSSELPGLEIWMAKALAAEPNDRFRDAIEMALAFASVTETVGTTIIDQSLLDRHETNVIAYVKWQPKQFYVQDSIRAVYESTDARAQAPVVVKVWHGIRRNTNPATDVALVRLLESAARVISAPVAGLPRFLEAGLSPVGPFVVYEHVNGTPLDSITALPGKNAIALCIQLLTAVGRLHELGCEHGDITKKNVIYDQTQRTTYVLDAFDLSAVGEGVIRTPAYCPKNWEQLSQQSIDRYAALSISADLLEQCRDATLDKLIAKVREERDRPIVETLEVAAEAMRATLGEISRPPLPHFRLFHPEALENFFPPDGDSYFLTRRSTGPRSYMYMLTGPRRELILSVEAGALQNAHFIRAGFGSLSYASRNGTKVASQIIVERGARAGFEELLAHLETYAVETISEPQAGIASTPTPVAVDIARLWDRMLDLETRDRLEVQIVGELAHANGATVYEFRSLGHVLDFDPDCLVDIYLPPNRRVGELERGFTPATNTLTVRNASRRLHPGDTIFLVDRREQTSIDRRTKAVRQILDDRAAIPNLVDYFIPSETPDATDYGIDVDQETLDAYDLNLGQQRAFQEVLRNGPLGLLQGPPGTGKTRFIASLVHWLMTKGGARRVLIASQSHEAVNNAIEALVDLYKSRGQRPNLLRIGSKGITEKIRPYHSAELRERYRIRFEAAIRYRVSMLAMEKGVDRAFVSDLLDVDESIGSAVRLCQRLRQLAQQTEPTTAAERARYLSELNRAEKKLEVVASKFIGKPVDIGKPSDILDQASAIVLSRHPSASSADSVIVRLGIDLARDWLSSMSSLHRNFDEFLAKTRSVITATCVGVGETKIRIDASQFDWVIVDEAARCTSSELAVPIYMGRRVLLVGDHLQLMPMITRKLVDAMQEEFPNVPREEITRSDFERAFLSSYGGKLGIQLTEQYRMDPAICDLVSHCFYEPHRVRLSTSPSRRSAFISPEGLPPVLAKRLTWIDTLNSTGANEIQPPNSTSYYNLAEIEATIGLLDAIAGQPLLVDALNKTGEETPIGVICMYSAQRDALDLACAKHSWSPKFRRLIRIDTVDSYQGKENSVVIVSLVRASSAREQGHVRIPNRCNVALSRAKERLFVVGSTGMWSSVPKGSPMRTVLEYFREHAEVASVISASTPQ